MEIFSSSNIFRIADLGCSTGPNTFMAVQCIIDAVDNKFKSHERSTASPKYQVFFNDAVQNDFNELFMSLPSDRKYFAAGVPGSFHGRLFPDASLHFVHSSFALHCLSSTPAGNIGRLYYSNSRDDEVVRSYEVQFAKDMNNFLSARAEEMVDSGLMALIFPGRPNGTPHSQVFSNKILELVESCIIDMVKKGDVTNVEALARNKMSAYMASPKEVEFAVQRNGCFSIEVMEILPQEKAQPKEMTSTIRAGMERSMKERFGAEVVDKLFDLFHKKLGEASSILESSKAANLFVFLKRKAIGTEKFSGGC
ncbi:hypothetical protein TIFTF001_015487 [Ficus carica]|uniref:S-adenosylmethionine-dependent methyltransferase n=1 Tax=Ficus carica TaxID=3494 RepID=A0AA88D7X0_FICCA|nr:hypothetical protein TIFTF001_015487 [Ficus carica]